MKKGDIIKMKDSESYYRIVESTRTHVYLSYMTSKDDTKEVFVAKNRVVELNVCHLMVNRETFERLKAKITSNVYHDICETWLEASRRELPDLVCLTNKNNQIILIPESIQCVIKKVHDKAKGVVYHEPKIRLSVRRIVAW